MKQDRTIRSYRRFAREAIRNWVKGRRKRRRAPPFLRWIFHRHCRPVLKKNGHCRVLDVGCGPGLDAIEFGRLGCEVTGVDAVPEFLAYARRNTPARLKKHIRFARADIRHIKSMNSSPHVGEVRRGVGGHYDLIWANASLIHFRKKTLPQVLRRLTRLASGGGILAATFFHGKGEGVYHGSFVPGRFFARYLKKELHQKFTQGGWKVQSVRTVANEDRRGRWLNVAAVPAR